MKAEWVVMAVAGKSFINDGVRRLQTRTKKASAMKLKKKWTKLYPDLIVTAKRWVY